jgi:3-deoxy-D-manno-octulosonic-acid transferase
MWNFYDITYGIGLLISAPYWLIKSSARRKVLDVFQARAGRIEPMPRDRPIIWIHAVSVGEANATRALVEQLAAKRSDVGFVVSATSATGLEQCQKIYASDQRVRVIRFPFDFSEFVDRALDAIKPTLLVLMELEVWPNFMQACGKRKIPVLIANGRMTEPSFRKYRWIAPVSRAMFGRLARVGAQDDLYSRRFIDLGVPADRVRITGTMKFDNARIEDRVQGDVLLAREVGLDPSSEFIWVCGSTGPGEEAIVLREYRELLKSHGRMRLVIVPRHDARFDEVAELIEASGFRCVRRAFVRLTRPSSDVVPPVVLGDTMGELRRFYSIGNVVFVGRSLVDLGARQHGSDMIEPAALEKPIIVGPFTGNFAEAMRKFKAADAMMEVPDGESLRQAVAVLHSTPEEAKAMASRARHVVRREQGATARHVSMILEFLPRTTATLPTPAPVAQETS